MAWVVLICTGAKHAGYRPITSMPAAAIADISVFVAEAMQAAALSVCQEVWAMMR